MSYDLELTRDYQPPEDLYVRVNVLQTIGQCVPCPLNLCPQEHPFPRTSSSQRTCPNAFPTQRRSSCASQRLANHSTVVVPHACAPRLTFCLFLIVVPVPVA